jgi:alpha-tubulin suppressor-like RCC1 family protein
VVFGIQNSAQDKRRSAAFEENPQIEDLKLGDNFSMALSNKGNIYCWGSNDCGQLALPVEQKFSFIPIHVSSLNGAQKISCGLKHCITLTKGG